MPIESAVRLWVVDDVEEYGFELALVLGSEIEKLAGKPVDTKAFSSVSDAVLEFSRNRPKLILCDRLMAFEEPEVLYRLAQESQVGWIWMSATDSDWKKADLKRERAVVQALARRLTSEIFQ